MINTSPNSNTCELNLLHELVKQFWTKGDVLEFVSKCVWDKLFIRFDDWHGGEKEYDEHERLAFVEWIEKYNYKFEITHGGYIGGVFVER